MDLSAGNQSKLQKSTTAPTGFTDVCDLLMRHPKPIVTCLNGPALGGGCVFLFLGDVRIASKDAYIQFAEVKRGLIPAMISCYIIPSIGKPSCWPNASQIYHSYNVLGLFYFTCIYCVLDLVGLPPTPPDLYI